MEIFAKRAFAMNNGFAYENHYRMHILQIRIFCREQHVI